MKVKLSNGTEYDVAASFPITLGDWRSLKSLGVMDGEGTMRLGDPDNLSAMLHHLLKKQDAAITQQMVDDIPFADVAKIMQFVGDSMSGEKQEETVDRPT